MARKKGSRSKRRRKASQWGYNPDNYGKGRRWRKQHPDISNRTGPKRGDSTKQTTAKEIVYADLNEAKASDGWCTKCGHYPNDTQPMNTDKGMKTLVKCSKCGNVMKPKTSSRYY